MLLLGGANAGVIDQGGDRMSSVDLARVITLTSSGATYDVAIEDLGDLGLNQSRFGHRATVLPDGSVLITGGLNGDPGASRPGSTSSRR